MGGKKKGRKPVSGVYERKDGRYLARFTSSYLTDANGNKKRLQKICKTEDEAINWLEDAKHADKHHMPAPTSKTPKKKEKATPAIIQVAPGMSLDAWVSYWLRNEKADRAPLTQRNYAAFYSNYISPIIGMYPVCDIKPLHCKAVLNTMYDTHKASTMRNTLRLMSSIFHSALNNGLIDKFPLAGVTVNKPAKTRDDVHVLSRAEQAAFLDAAKNTANYPQYALVLETGLRTSEMIGLTWDNIDWANRTLSVRKTLMHYGDSWTAGSLKSTTSYRTIPLTDKAYKILYELYERRIYRKEAPELDQILTYLDRRTGAEESFNLKDLVFVSKQYGMPNYNGAYNTHLRTVCEKAGIKYICMHALRHTFATRAIESGMQPYILQHILGHSTLQMTMDTYVHAQRDAEHAAMANFGVLINLESKL